MKMVAPIGSVARRLRLAPSSRSSCDENYTADQQGSPDHGLQVPCGPCIGCLISCSVRVHPRSLAALEILNEDIDKRTTNRLNRSRS